jgi:SAM-dependent methyltransferase
VESRAAWLQAQESEKQFWLTTWGERSAEQVVEVQREKAEGTIRQLAPWRTFTPETRTLQVGCALAGQIHQLVGRRAAIDPLADFFRERWPEALDPAVDYRSGKGERLPWRAGEFDIVICDNTLDHCEDPEQVARELLRVTSRDGGIIAFSVHVFGRLGAALHASPLRAWLDPQHPHTLILDEVGDLFAAGDPLVSLRVLDRKVQRVRIWSKGLAGLAKRALTGLGLGPSLLSQVMTLERAG